MKSFTPIEIQSVGEGNAQEFMIRAIDELPKAVEPAHPHRHGRAVRDRPKPLFALGQNPFCEFARRYVDHDGVEAQGASRLIPVRNMHDLGLNCSLRSRKIGLVRQAFASERALDEGPASFIHRRPHDLAHMTANDLAQGTFEPGIVGLVDEAKRLIVIEIGDEERDRVRHSPQPALAFLHGCFRIFLVGNVEVRANQL